jgi:hypothetical protein
MFKVEASIYPIDSEIQPPDPIKDIGHVYIRISPPIETWRMIINYDQFNIELNKLLASYYYETLTKATLQLIEAQLTNFIKNKINDGSVII